MLNEGEGEHTIEEDLSLAIKANFIKDLSENVTILNNIRQVYFDRGKII